MLAPSPGETFAKLTTCAFLSKGGWEGGGGGPGSTSSSNGLLQGYLQPEESTRVILPCRGGPCREGRKGLHSLHFLAIINNPVWKGHLFAREVTRLPEDARVGNSRVMTIAGF